MSGAPVCIADPPARVQVCCWDAFRHQALNRVVQGRRLTHSYTCHTGSELALARACKLTRPLRMCPGHSATVADSGKRPFCSLSRAGKGGPFQGTLGAAPGGSWRIPVERQLRLFSGRASVWWWAVERAAAMGPRLSEGRRGRGGPSDLQELCSCPRRLSVLAWDGPSRDPVGDGPALWF